MRSKFQRRHRASYGPSHYFELATGGHYLRGGFDGDLDAMREAWSDPAVREKTRATRQARQFGVVFADLAFGPEGEGGLLVVDGDYDAVREQFREQRDSNSRQTQDFMGE